MKIMTFHELYTLDFALDDLFAQKQKWTRGVLFEMNHPRHSSAMIYLNGCHGIYTNQRGEVIDAPCKSLVYLPYGSEYTVLNFDCGKDSPDAYLTEFNIVSGGDIVTCSDSPFVMENVNSYLASEIMREAVEAYEAPVPSPVALKASFYRLLTFLSRETHNAYNRKFHTIARGIQLLEENALGRMSIEEIADSCNVSSGCFRKLFRAYSGKSPNQYRMDLKLNMAKHMLCESNVSVSDVSESLGFENSAYFCRFFKKKTGLTPGEYRQHRF